MTASIRGAEDETRENPGIEGEQPPVAEPTTAAAGSSAVSRMAGTANDRCPACSAELAADQRYCVECGTRRGAARFAPAARRPAPAGAAVIPGSVRQRFGGNATTALAIVIVLLALGIGVLIGNSGTQTVRVVVKGAVAGSTTSGNGAGSTASGKRSTASGKRSTGSGKGASSSSAKPAAPKTTTSPSNFFSN